MHGGGSLNAWEEQWLPHSMHGARSGHEVYDVSYELALLIEQHQRKGDSWSVQVAFAVMAAWSKTMMEAHVHTSRFLDDSNFRANNLELQDGEISDQPAKHLMQLSTEFASMKRSFG